MFLVNSMHIKTDSGINRNITRMIYIKPVITHCSSGKLWTSLKHKNFLPAMQTSNAPSLTHER